MLSCARSFLVLDCPNVCTALIVSGSSFEDSRFPFSLGWLEGGYEYEPHDSPGTP